jgi:hypothetical protein
LNELELLVGYRRRATPEIYLGDTVTADDYSSPTPFTPPYYGNSEELDGLIQSTASRIPSDRLRGFKFQDEPIIQKILRDRVEIDQSSQEQRPVAIVNPEIKR